MSQTSYSLYQAAAFAGMLGDIGDHSIDSRTAEAAIGFGVPVILGTDPDRQIKPTALGVGDGILVTGFSVATHAVEQSAAGVANYAIKSTVSRLRAGKIWVMTDDAVVAGAVANLKLASGYLTDAAVASGIEAITQLRCRFLTSTTGSGLALIEVSPL